MKILVYSNYKEKGKTKKIVQYGNMVVLEIEDDYITDYEPYIAKGIDVESFENMAVSNVSSNLTARLIDKCDKLTRDAKSIIAGFRVSEEQVFRYEKKYEIAKIYKQTGNLGDILKIEADKVGESVDKLADEIITVANEYNQELYKSIELIEGFRRYVKKLIEDKEFDKAQKLIDTATLESIKGEE